MKLTFGNPSLPERQCLVDGRWITMGGGRGAPGCVHVEPAASGVVGRFGTGSEASPYGFVDRSGVGDVCMAGL